MSCSLRIISTSDGATIPTSYSQSPENSIHTRPKIYNFHGPRLFQMIT